MPAASRSSCRRSTTASWSIAALPATSRETWRQVARATAAHSTVTFNDTSSCRFLTSRVAEAAARRADPVRPDRRRRSSRQERDDGMVLRASHDGYVEPLRRRASAHAAALARRHARSTARICSCRRMARACRPGAATNSRCASTCIRLVKANRHQRRPRRHAGAAEPGGVDLRRLRGAGRARGKRLSWPAPTGRAARCRS